MCGYLFFFFIFVVFHITGDAYVDWVGYDAYNWGDSNPDWGHWISSANLTHSYAISRVGYVAHLLLLVSHFLILLPEAFSIFFFFTFKELTLNRSVSPNKPMCIAETGCATKGASIQLKNAWIKELFPYVLCYLSLF